MLPQHCTCRISTLANFHLQSQWHQPHVICMTVHAASGHLALLHHSIHIPIGLLLQSNCVHRHWRQLSSCIRATWKNNQRSSICTIVIFLRSWISWFEHLQYFVFVASVVRAFAKLLSYCIHVPSICKIVFFFAFVVRAFARLFFFTFVAVLLIRVPTCWL